MDRNKSDHAVRPLDNITVVDLTQVIAGPFGSMILGDYGAEVIKIEAPGRGDTARTSYPAPQYFDTLNRNKRSISIDLKSSEGQAVAHSLLEDADVLIENTKPGRIKDFGLDYETVTEVNPNIVMCSITGFGQGSPYEGNTAMDKVVQAMSGIMSLQGPEDGPSMWSGLPIGDLAASLYAVQSILAALFARSEGRIESEWIEVPMFDVAISLLGPRAGYSFGVSEPHPRGGRRNPLGEPNGTFICQDEPIIVQASGQALWQDFCRAINREDLIEDERFKTREDRMEHTRELLEIIEPILASKSAVEWIEIFRQYEVPTGPVNDTKTVWEDEHVQERGLKVTMEREGREDAEVVDHPVHFSKLIADVRSPPPEVGGDTRRLLQNAGYDEADIDRLFSDNIVY